MVAILFRFLNHIHQFGFDNFVVELIWVDHVLTIHHIYDEQMLNYFQVVHHLHPKENKNINIIKNISIHIVRLTKNNSVPN